MLFCSGGPRWTRDRAAFRLLLLSVTTAPRSGPGPFTLPTTHPDPGPDTHCGPLSHAIRCANNSPRHGETMSLASTMPRPSWNARPWLPRPLEAMSLMTLLSMKPSMSLGPPLTLVLEAAPFIGTTMSCYACRGAPLCLRTRCGTRRIVLSRSWPSTSSRHGYRARPPSISAWRKQLLRRWLTLRGGWAMISQGPTSPTRTGTNLLWMRTAFLAPGARLTRPVSRTSTYS